jgi:uncharacterized protein (DUF433 family)
MQEDLLKRITVDPNICHGKPVIRGLRYPVVNMLELMASGMTNEEVLADYEDLEEADLQAYLLLENNYGALHLRIEQIRFKEI